jgi:hypothetical protein
VDIKGRRSSFGFIIVCNSKNAAECIAMDFVMTMWDCVAWDEDSALSLAASHRRVSRLQTSS